ncbi:four helix bundle protein [Desulfonatronovibrio magnus]|uniref:four helix bundle protein n=1 Tax=Desulfonatronovibrio magnus TaxID=698827 RepID=UPI0018DC9B18|nr:four helix bundle protein [Desulfonatronovibrio magnus]
MNDTQSMFAFEDLKVWQKAVDFAEVVIKTIDSFDAPRKHYRLIEQLESAATSPAMNIAEGKGRYSQKEFVHFLYIARGSLFETITLLIILQRLGWITHKDLQGIKVLAEEIAKMLNSLINSIKN